MKFHFLILIIFFFSAGVDLLAEEITGGLIDDKVNSNAQDYGAYITYGEKTDTLFFTSSRRVKNRRPIALRAEIFFSIRPAADRDKLPLNVGWSKCKQINADASRIAEFTRGSQAIGSGRIIFAAERDLSTETAKGTSYLFDLWEMTRTADGFSLPKPLENVNDPDAWDSQPALSTDGKILYFVTNREGGPGGLDIWYSVRDESGKWAAPKPVPDINTPGNEISPHCGADGRFYFSSDWNYKENKKGENGKDIFRADYKSVGGIQLPVNPINLDDALKADAEHYGLTIPGDINYNSKKDDEFPFITSDRKGIFITSNREDKYRHRNLYAFRLPKSKIRLLVNVRERIFDANGDMSVPPTLKKGLPLTIVDEKSGTETELKSGIPQEVEADRNYKIKFTKFVEEECYQNKIEGPEEMTVFTKNPFGPDTLFIKEALITRRKIEIPPVVFHSTDTLPYFITGYWYPNTSENIADYRKREASGFFDETGFVDSSGYNYDNISNKIDRTFEKEIYKPLEKLLPVFQDFCQDTLFLKVTIHGYTDPRGLSAGNEHPYRPQSRYKRKYPDTGVTVGVDEKGNDVQIETGMDMFKKSWTEEENSKKIKVVLPDEGEEGNVLLSKLRAFYTFVTFDKEMRKRSPIYSELRDNNRVLLDAEGFGIDKKGFEERHLRDDPISRRIEIYLDVLYPEEVVRHKRLAGGEIAGVEKNKITQAERPDELLKADSEMTKTEKVNANIKEAKIIDKNESVFSDQFKNKDKEQEISQPQLPPKDVFANQSEIKPEELCFSIQYQTYKILEEAEKGFKILNENDITSPAILEYYDEFGNKTFRLRSGCFKSASEASQYLSGLKEVSEKLGLNRKPYIVR